MEIKIVAFFILWAILLLWLWPAGIVARSGIKNGMHGFAWLFLALVFSWLMIPIFLFATRKKSP